MYISWNNFNVGGGAIQVICSDDGGATWTAPVNVDNSFVRNVQISVGPRRTRLHRRRWTRAAAVSATGRTSSTARRMAARPGPRSTTGAAFPGPGQSTCRRLTSPRCSRPTGGTWAGATSRPARTGSSTTPTPQHGTGSDFGDIYYVRSTDNGVTWSTPIKLNTRRRNALAVAAVAFGLAERQRASSAGTTRATRRATTSSVSAASRRTTARRGGTTSVMSATSPSPLPSQPDPNVQPCYTGDYDRSYSERRGPSTCRGWTGACRSTAPPSRTSSSTSRRSAHRRRRHRTSCTI